MCRLLTSGESDFRKCFQIILALRSTCKLLYRHVSCSLLSFPLEINNENDYMSKDSKFIQFLTMVLDKCDWSFHTVEVQIPKPAFGSDGANIQSYMLQVLCFFEDFSSLFVKDLQVFKLKVYQQLSTLEPFVHLIACKIFNENTVIHFTDGSRSLNTGGYNFIGDASRVREVTIEGPEFSMGHVDKWKYLTKITLAQFGDFQLSDIASLEYLEYLDVGGIEMPGVFGAPQTLPIFTRVKNLESVSSKCLPLA